MKVSELIEQLQKLPQDADIVADTWMAGDIRESVDNEDLTDSQCEAIINYLNKHMDSDIGITNDRIFEVMNNLIESGEI